MCKDILEDKNIGVDMMNNLNNINIPPPTQVTVNSVQMESSAQSRLPEKVRRCLKRRPSTDCILRFWRCTTCWLESTQSWRESNMNLPKVSMFDIISLQCLCSLKLRHIIFITVMIFYFKWYLLASALISAIHMRRVIQDFLLKFKYIRWPNC